MSEESSLTGNGSRLKQGEEKAVFFWRVVASRIPFIFITCVLKFGLFSFRIVFSCGSIFGDRTLS